MGCQGGQYCDDPNCSTHGNPSGKDHFSYRRYAPRRGCQGGQYCDDPNCETHGRGSCFPESTCIRTPEGERAIGSFEAHDWVLSWDIATGRLHARRVTKVLRYAAGRVWEVRFNRGMKPLRVTERHRLLSDAGWLKVSELRQGQRLFRVVGGQAACVQISHIAPAGVTEAVVNLHTEREHTFIADGFVAHNFSLALSARTLFHRMILDRLRLAPRLCQPSLNGVT